MGIFKRKQEKNLDPQPNPEPKPKIMNQIVLAFLRHLLTFIGGTVVAKGLLDEATMTELVGALISFISVGWMTIDKIKKKPE
jgi:heme A synthase